MDSSEQEDEGEGTRPHVTRRLRDPSHYRRFIEEGGVLLAAFDQERQEFLLDELGLEEVRDVTRAHRLEGAYTQTVVTRMGETLTLDWAGSRSIDAPPRLGGEALAADSDRPSRAVARRISVGRGELVLLPNDSLFDNENIGKADNALFLVRVLEELGPIEAVYFDEYALGGWVPETSLELALAPKRFAFTTHLLALLGVLIWSLAWAGAFPRDPQPLNRTSPRARARSQGGMMVHHARYGQLASMLRRGVLARLPGAGRRRVLQDKEDAKREIRAALAPIAHLARDDNDFRGWEKALLPGRVDSAEALDELARTLVRLERLAHAGSKGQNLNTEEEDAKHG